MTSSALTRQVGGNHYKTMGIQPIVFASVNRYDPAAFSVLKYVSRHRRKHGREDLEKAKHFVELRLQTLTDHPTLASGPAAVGVITVKEYAEANGLSDVERVLLEDLHVWACRTNVTLRDATAAHFICNKIDYLISLHYPEQKD